MFREDVLDIVRSTFKIEILTRLLALNFKKDIPHHFFVPTIRSTEFLLTECRFELHVVGINLPQCTDNLCKT